MTFSSDDARSFCQALAQATFDYPFGPGVRVYRVGGKIFALTLDDEARINLKCDPGLAEVLRQTFDAVKPGYHQGKRHWNTITLDGSVPDPQVIELIEHSYGLVLASLTRKVRAELGL